MQKVHAPKLSAVLLALMIPSYAVGEVSEEDLQELRGEIVDTEERQQEYQRQVNELGDETKKLRRRLVAVTARVLEKEAAVNEAEANLAALEV